LHIGVNGQSLESDVAIICDKAKRFEKSIWVFAKALPYTDKKKSVIVLTGLIFVKKFFTMIKFCLARK
jgi:hypothetical protein